MQMKTLFDVDPLFVNLTGIHNVSEEQLDFFWNVGLDDGESGKDPLKFLTPAFQNEYNWGYVTGHNIAEAEAEGTDDDWGYEYDDYL